MTVTVSKKDRFWVVKLADTGKEYRLEAPQDIASQCLMVWEGIDPDKPSDRMLILSRKQDDKNDLALTLYDTPRLNNLPGVDVWGPDGKIIPVMPLFEEEAMILVSEGGRSLHMIPVGIEANKVDVIHNGQVLDLEVPLNV